MRTFLEALDRSNVDCREANGANWAGRSPLLGSIAMCRPKWKFMLESASLYIFPDARAQLARFSQTSEIPAAHHHHFITNKSMLARCCIIHSSVIEIQEVISHTPFLGIWPRDPLNTHLNATSNSTLNVHRRLTAATTP
jgi:hypothetical protein